MEEGRLRIGKVTDINLPKRLLRVHFGDVNIVSDWLKVISYPPNTWFPKIDDTVLCIFDSGFSPTGYVLGRLE